MFFCFVVSALALKTGKHQTRGLSGQGQLPGVLNRNIKARGPHSSHRRSPPCPFQGCNYHRVWHGIEPALGHNGWENELWMAPSSQPPDKRLSLVDRVPDTDKPKWTARLEARWWWGWGSSPALDNRNHRLTALSSREVQISSKMHAAHSSGSCISISWYPTNPAASCCYLPNIIFK